MTRAPVGAFEEYNFDVTKCKILSEFTRAASAELEIIAKSLYKYISIEHNLLQ